MHKITVMKMLSEIHPETRIYERKIKTASVVRMNCIHATQGSEQVCLGHLIPNELNQPIPSVIG
jgi:hypothetical protein